MTAMTQRKIGLSQAEVNEMVSEAFQDLAEEVEKVVVEDLAGESTPAKIATPARRYR